MLASDTNLWCQGITPVSVGAHQHRGMGDRDRRSERQGNGSLRSVASSTSMLHEMEKQVSEPDESDALQTPEEAAEPVPPPWTEQITVRAVVAAAILVFLLCLLSQRTSLGAGDCSVALSLSGLIGQTSCRDCSPPDFRCHASLVSACRLVGLLLHQDLHSAAPAYRHRHKALHTTRKHCHPDMRSCWSSSGDQRRLWLFFVR